MCMEKFCQRCVKVHSICCNSKKEQYPTSNIGFFSEGKFGNFYCRATCFVSTTTNLYSALRVRGGPTYEPQDEKEFALHFESKMIRKIFIFTEKILKY